MENTPVYYYHGTTRAHAYSIMSRGFNLQHEIWGRGWGRGVYLSGTDRFGAMWGEIIIVCELRAGARILWHTEHDPKVIDSMRREFGRQIATPEFWKVLPRNKQLTRRELSNLWWFLMAKHYANRRRFSKRMYQRLAKNYSRLHEQLKRQGYDGVGYRDPVWPEVLVFNPSMIEPVSVHRWRRVRQALGAPIARRRLAPRRTKVKDPE